MNHIRKRTKNVFFGEVLRSKILNVGKKEWLIAEGSNQEPVRIQLFTSARSQKHINTHIYIYIYIYIY